MSVQRIDNPRGHTHGWQARAHLAPGQRLTAFFSDSVHGGTAQALKRAEKAEAKLWIRVRELKRMCKA